MFLRSDSLPYQRFVLRGAVSLTMALTLSRHVRSPSFLQEEGPAEFSIVLFARLDCPGFTSAYECLEKLIKDQCRYVLVLFKEETTLL